MQVKLQASGQLLSASSQQCSDENTAKQQAALSMVHQMQHAILAMLTTSQPDLAMPSDQAMDETPQEAQSTVVHEGDHENSTPEVGHVVKMQYELVLSSGSSDSAETHNHDLSHQGQSDPKQQGNGDVPEPLGVQDVLSGSMLSENSLEHSSMLRFEYGGGGVIPELENAGVPCICRFYTPTQLTPLLL